MRTLRERPSRGLDVSPAKKASPTSARSSRATGQTTPRSERKLSGAAANMAGDAIEVRESIEAKGDVEMSDVQDTVAARRYNENDGDADADADGDLDADGDVDMDADGEPDDDAEQAQNQESIDLLQLIKQTTEYLCEYTVNEGEEDEYQVAEPFQRLVNKRSLPDYFEVIKEPIAFSTIRGKIGKKNYQNFAQFVADVTRICWNAMYYNRPSSQIFKDAGLLLEVFKKKLAELVEKGTITEKEAVLPDYGPLPEIEDSPPAEEELEEDEEDEDEEEEEEDEEDDESDDEGRKKRRNRSARQSSRRDGADVDHSKRGRPPKVFTPLEARIEAILKGLRRYKNADGHLGITAFEKLPDKTVLPEYYAAISNPISLEIIKKNHKRKKYKTVDQMVQDLDLMFENAKTFNEEESVVHQDAIQLQKDAHQLAEEQKATPDDEFRDSDGRLPLSSVVHKDETWRVGDWVHIRNPNDLSKPIVGQIYRLWSDMSGEKKLNACWYYRPEQTVHRFDKYFWKNEVVKTGRYRDHNVNEIEDRCFVMYITRYHRGRPRGFPRDKAVYVCESRYNEDNHRFNKIKTWSSCLPDEVRDKDYEMDLFETPLPLQKEPSKIKHLLHPNARETDELPVPTWGALNAPPMIGAVHRRPREANESPPPEERPKVAPIPQALAMGPSARPVAPGMAAPFHPGAPAGQQFQQFQVARQAPPPVPHGQAGQVHIQPQPHATPGMHVQHPQQHLTASMAHMQPQQHPGQQPMQLQPLPPQGGPAQQQHFPPHPYQPPFAAQPQAPQQIHYQNAAHLAPAAAYDHHHRQQLQPGLAPGMTPPRHPATMTPTTPTAPPMQPHPTSATIPNGQYNMPRPMEAYTLPENLDSSIPQEVREQFQRDDTGRVLFFTAPPLNRPANGVAPEQAGLGHSVSHLANINKVREERRKQKAARDAELQEEANKKLRANKENISTMRKQMEEQEMFKRGMEWLDSWVKEMNDGTAWILEQTGAAYFPTKEEKQRRRNMTENEREVDLRNWYIDYLFRNGHITAEEKEKRLKEVFERFGPPYDDNKHKDIAAENQDVKATQA